MLNEVLTSNDPPVFHIALYTAVGGAWVIGIIILAFPAGDRAGLLCGISPAQADMLPATTIVI
jgi:hypothetical protein